ncbi:MAG: DNA/RNA non-specific endonuclease [Planctomycetes bacterium]|nr:DNA/RNA non-specific endonuclease [Planctomycetota bacterium]
MTPRSAVSFRTLGLTTLIAGSLGLPGCGDSQRQATVRPQPPIDDWAYSIDTGVGGRPDTTRPMSDPLRLTYYGLPVSNPLAEPAPVQLFNSGYAVGYDAATKTPIWASYRLFAGAGSGPAAKGAVSPIPDERVVAVPPVDEAAKANQPKGQGDYGKNSQFQARLLVPSAPIAGNYGEDAGHQTQLSSNVVPVRMSTGGDVWDQITDLESRYASAYDELWVLAGPLPGTDQTLPSGAAISEGFWKIHVTVRKGRTRIQAFIVPQPAAEKNAQQKTDLADYLVSVAEIEQKTGLSFFPDCHDIDGDTAELRRIQVPEGLWATERETTASR